MSWPFFVGIPSSAMAPKSHSRVGSLSYCGKTLDLYGDHAATCGMGGHLFTRHGGLNSILCQAGRDAGYVALMEQRHRVTPNEKISIRTRNGERIHFLAGLATISIMPALTPRYARAHVRVGTTAVSSKQQNALWRITKHIRSNTLRVKH